MENKITLEQAIEWNNSTESVMWLCDEFGLFSCDEPMFDEIESDMINLLKSNNIEIK